MKTLSKIKMLILGLFILTPAFALFGAEPWGGGGGGGKDFKQLVTDFLGGVLNPVVYILFGLAFIYFLVGVIKYLRAGEGGDKKEEDRKILYWGVIAMFVIVSVWGLVNLLSATFNLDSTVPAPSTFKK